MTNEEIEKLKTGDVVYVERQDGTRINFYFLWTIGKKIDLKPVGQEIVLTVLPKFFNLFKVRK